jgi:excinuclease UvrABC nuclease subunit
MNKAYIYGLYDILDKSRKIMYVGKTRSLSQRFESHKSFKKRSKLGLWIGSMRIVGSIPQMEVLEITEEIYADAKEGFWIKQLNPTCNGHKYI